VKTFLLQKAQDTGLIQAKRRNIQGFYRFIAKKHLSSFCQLIFDSLEIDCAD
jgi:hypothetical protein